MKIEITRSSEILTEQDIRLFEEQYGLSIPIEYRKFLLSHNGGQPTPSGFSMFRTKKSDPEFGDVKRFLGINVSEKTLRLDYVLKTFQGRIPSEFFPVARDPGGNLIGIIVNGVGSGKVYFWDQEYEAEEGSPPSNKNLYFIADSFDEFIDKLSE